MNKDFVHSQQKKKNQCNADLTFLLLVVEGTVPLAESMRNRNLKLRCVTQMTLCY